MTSRSRLGVKMEERGSCSLAFRASCSIMSRAVRRAIVAYFLFLRYCQCLCSNILEGSLAKLVGMRNWSRVMIVEER